MVNKYKKTLIVLLGLVLLGEIFIVYTVLTNKNSEPQEVKMDDVAALEALPADFEVIKTWLDEHAKTSDAVDTYKTLLSSQLPPNIDLHLLGHEVGTRMYEQYGLSAMQYCTPDLRNACSHAVVVGALLDNGLQALEEVHEICQKAPGGSGAYTMCFHGLGHGVLAFTEYDFDAAVALCKSVGTAAYNNEEAGQCVGGAVMELRDGVHDRAMWETKISSYLNTENPLSLCQRPSIFPEAKQHCYSYVTPFLFDAAGAKGELPREEHYGPALALCEKEPNAEFKQQCYAGFGKEFIVLAGQYDIQNLDELPTEAFAQAASWCTRAPTPEAVKACSFEIVHSLYWGGENNIKGAVRYCSVLENELRTGCFDALYDDVSTYNNSEHRRTVCSLVPKDETQRCRDAGLGYNET